jgi:hypothetical protein
MTLAWYLVELVTALQLYEYELLIAYDVPLAVGLVIVQFVAKALAEKERHKIRAIRTINNPCRCFFVVIVKILPYFFG